ncbi:hypothetical protein LTR37_006982 [Vermiconidia calcicola]|uniref:Uncharacterized protein n=1 Tax=Vermiconidia calcicola TaxID=1690605 RepID=A0ACC3NFE0_9PEZI|nr:hypothetical protein LTR37_006982 [Vermiconidia calcicola]
MSRLPSSRAYIESSRNGIRAATDKSSSGESSLFEEGERRSSEGKQAGTGSTQHLGKEDAPEDGPADAPELARKKEPNKKRRKAGVKGPPNKRYKDLLQDEVRNARDPKGRNAELLPPSQIGGSFWTSAEKETFFLALVLRGTDNLAAISKAIGTKSEPEVRRYLLLLHRDGAGGLPSNYMSTAFKPADIPAAYEIQNQCETALNSAADALADYVYQHEMDLERQTFGNYWLIDKDTAADIKENLPQTILVPAVEEPGQDFPNGSNHERDVKGEIAGNGGPAGKTGSADRSQHHNDDSMLSVPSAALLRPEMFCQLSCSLFMNNGTELSNNWHSVGLSDSASSCPALFRSAFEDIHSIVIDRTRTIVQASIFQARTRLRARDESRPALVVIEDDVKIATALLGLDNDWKKYWVTAARRSGVNVYSEAKRYLDGRPGTKNGVKLTYDEVEAELSVGPPLQPEFLAEFGSHCARETIEGSSRPQPRARQSHSESSSSDDIPGSHCNKKSKNEDASVSDSNVDAEKSRNERESSTSHDSEEDEDTYFESLDQRASLIEERRLLELLGHETLPPEIDEDQGSPLSKPLRTDHDAKRYWQERTTYEAEWEQYWRYLENDASP